MGLEVKIPIEKVQEIGVEVRANLMNQAEFPGFFRMMVNVVTRDFTRLELHIVYKNILIRELLDICMELCWTCTQGSLKKGLQ